MTTTELVQQVIEQTFGAIHQIDGQWYLPCPGRACHTHPSTTKDCSVYPHADTGRFPRVVLHCVHDSCDDDVRMAQQRLNDRIEDVMRNNGYQIQPMTDEERLARQQAAQQADRKKQLQLVTEKLRPSIIQNYPTTLAEFKASSPVAVPVNPQDGWRLFLECLFGLTDVLWMGHEMHSGYPIYAANFQTAESWLATHPQAPHPFTTPSIFTPGSFSRTKANVVAGKYLVFESDVLNQLEQLAVGRYLREKHGLDLRAAIFSGNKSIHFWFHLDSPQRLETPVAVISWPRSRSQSSTADATCPFTGLLPCRQTALAGTALA